MKIKNFSDFKEQDKELLIKEIKSFLISDECFDCKTWEQFVDKQRMGDCQLIVRYIINEFGKIGVKKVFGHIEVDEPSFKWEEVWDEELEDWVEKEKSNNLFTHHWIEYEGQYFDFSKGTLTQSIDWINKYDPSIEGEEWRYS